MSRRLQSVLADLKERYGATAADLTADELEAHDLVRVKTRDWSRSDTVTMTKER